MAKKRRKSSKCPEPFNTLIDLAAAATLDYIAYKRRQKHGGRRKNKIDPYAAAGVAMGMGKLNSTEDIIKLGGFLGAMGAFDDDDKEPSYTYASQKSSTHRTYLSNAHKPTNRNRYAWRMNCEDGSDYGISPENYETRDEYNEALRKVKSHESVVAEINEVPSVNPVLKYDCEKSVDTVKICKVSILGNGQNKLYKTEDAEINVGDTVVVPLDNGGTGQGIVIVVKSAIADECVDIPLIIEKCN